MAWEISGSRRIAWGRLRSLGIAWDRLDSHGIAWNRLRSLVVAWDRLGSPGMAPDRLRSAGVARDRLGSPGSAWDRLGSLGSASGRLGSPGAPLGVWDRLGGFHAYSLLSLVRPGFVTISFWGCSGWPRGQNNSVTTYMAILEHVVGRTVQSKRLVANAGAHNVPVPRSIL
jgi:hypothetical protein